MRIVKAVAALALLTVAGCNSNKLAGENPAIDVSPSTIVFDPTAPGATNVKVATVTNHGGGTLVVSGITIGGTTPAAFAADASAGGAFPINLGPGAWFAVQVTFAPSDAGNHSGVMTVLSNDIAHPSVDVSLVTAALAPNLDASPNPLNLTATVNQSVSGTITVTNTGSADLNVSGATLGAGSSSFFALAAGSLPTTLTPGSSTTLSVTFHPTNSTAATGSVDIASDDPDSPTTTVALNGNGAVANVPDINAVPNPLSMGDVQRLTCKTLTTNVQNVGTATLNVTSINKAIIPTSNDWTVTPTSFTVAPGGSKPLTVTFCPSYTGSSFGVLAVSSNDPDENPYNITVTGNGTPPPLSATDISVKLTWDKNDTDVDTHLWRSSGAYKSSTGDCYYANCVGVNPDWGIPGNHTDDPYLDTDDVDGYGPENLNLSNAASDTYTAAIFYYSDHTNGNTTATATVYVNGTQVWSGSKNLANHDLWTLGTIVWNHTTDTGTWTLNGSVAPGTSPLAPGSVDNDPPKPNETHGRPMIGLGDF